MAPCKGVCHRSSGPHKYLQTKQTASVILHCYIFNLTQRAECFRNGIQWLIQRENTDIRVGSHVGFLQSSPSLAWTAQAYMESLQVQKGHFSFLIMFPCWLLLYLHGLVTVCKVVDDGERLLEAWTASQRHVGDQLAYGDNDLDKKQDKVEGWVQRKRRREK